MTMIIDGSTGLEFPDGSDQTSAYTGNASTITSGTLPAARLPSSGVNAASITVGTIDTARLATGTANSSTYLRGDQTWAAIASSQWVTSGANISYTTGNVGIGTSTPTARLDVSSSSAGVTAGDLVVDTTNKVVYVGRTSSTSGDNGKLVVRNRVGDALTITGDTTADGTGLFRPGTNLLGFTTNATQRAQIDSSGNFYVGADTTCNLTDFRSKSLAASGYQRIAGGLILQWGSQSVNNNVQTTITFPIAFPTACQSAQFNSRSSDGSSIFFWDMRSLSASSTSIYTGRPSGGAASTTIYWFAVGY
jgi:hypothetical protein